MHRVQAQDVGLQHRLGQRIEPQEPAHLDVVVERPHHGARGDVKLEMITDWPSRWREGA